MIVLVLLAACMHYACLKELLRGDRRGVSHGVVQQWDDERLGRLIEALPTVSVCPGVRLSGASPRGAGTRQHVLGSAPVAAAAVLGAVGGGWGSGSAGR